MKILIIGTGNMARGISTRLLAGGHEVQLYNPDQADAEQLASELGHSAAERARVSVAPDLSRGIAASAVVVLASWYPVNLETARERASELSGKVVVDISNPLNETFDGLVTEGGPSAAERIREVLPAGAAVVKAFNTTFAGTLLDGSVAGQPLDVFLAGDDRGAKATVAAMVASAGLNPVDVGALKRARELEAIGLLGITLQEKLGTGFMSAWRLLLPDQVRIAKP